MLRVCSLLLQFVAPTSELGEGLLRTFNYRLKEFMGLYDRGGGGITPRGFSPRFENLVFDGDVVRNRNSAVKDADFKELISSAVAFKPSDAALTRILYSVGESGALYTSAGHTLVHTIDGGQYFSAQSFNGRLYVTPHNNREGLSGEFVYVWNGTNSFRKAGGAAPTESFVISETGVAGRLQVGVRIFALVYQTDSGF